MVVMLCGMVVVAMVVVAIMLVWTWWNQGVVVINIMVLW